MRRPIEPIDPLLNLVHSLASRSSAVGECSADGDDDAALERILGIGLAQTGAKRAGWRPAGSDRALLARGPDPMRGPAECARAMHELDWSMVRELELGRVFRIRAAELARSARAGARSANEWIVIRPEGGHGTRGTLWIETVVADAVRDSDVAFLAQALAHLADAAENLERKPAEVRLHSLARNAGAWIHDLRHAFQLVRLLTERLAESGETRVVHELMACVSEGENLCGRALRAGDRRLATRSVFLRPLLNREASAAVSLAGRGASVRVCIDCPDELVVETDPTTLARIARNLLLNAIDASHDGGEVEIRACASTAREYELCVRDHGRGIASEDLDRLLACGQSGGRGTGFGTSSTADCVSALGGRMEWQSRLGSGTCARAVIPNARSAQSDRDVVVICCDPRRRADLARRFEARGWRAVEAADGEAALETLARFGPCDVTLVRGSGGIGLDALHETVRELGRGFVVVSISDGGTDRSVDRAIEWFGRTARAADRHLVRS